MALIIEYFVHHNFIIGSKIIIHTDLTFNKKI